MELSPRTPTLPQRTRLTAEHLTGILWLVAIAVLIGVFVYRERGEIVRTVAVLRQASLAWALVAGAAGLAIHGLLGLTYQPIFRRLGDQIGWLPLVRAHLQRHVVGTVVPLGGPASMYTFVRTLNRHGITSENVLYAVLLNSILGYASFAIFLIPVLALVIVDGDASAVELVAAVVLFVIVALMIAAMVTLVRGGERFEALRGRLPNHPITDRVGTFIGQARGHGLRPGDLLRPLGIHLLVELAGVATLYACLRAVGWDAPITEAIVGYAVGTLFLLIAPVFQGIGAVELSMTVALARFGLPAGTALAAVLLYRAAEVWGPFILGVSVQAADQPGVRRGSTHLPAIVTGVTGLLAALSAIAPRLPSEVSQVDRYSLVDPADLSRHLTLLAGFFLIFLSISLWRRKRVAWLAAIVLLGVTSITHVVKGHDQVVALVAGANLLLLVLDRDRFHVRSDLPTVRLGLTRFGLSLGFAASYGVLGFFLLDQRAFGIEFDLMDSLRQTGRLYFNIGDSNLVARTRYASWFLDSLSLIGVVSLAYAAFSVTRPVVWRHRTLPLERERARRLIERYGDSSLDRFKWWPDKVFFFASNEQAVISYRVALAAAVALGDPVARDIDDFRRVLREFLEFCDANGWRVAFHQVPPTHLPEYQWQGLSALKIGEDAIVDLETFSLAGRAMRSLRQNVNRLERDGYRTVYYPAPLSDDLVARLREVSDEWLSIPGRRERGFTLGQFEESYVRSTPVITVEDAGGRIVAFANIIPDGVEGEATIDLMRRRQEPSGAMDYLQVRLLERLRDDGYHRFSLGLAPFAEVGTAPGATASERAVHLFYEHFNRFFSYKGLREYKDKFGPAWEPSYIVYQSELALPMIALALVRITEAQEVGSDGGLVDDTPELPADEPLPASREGTQAAAMPVDPVPSPDEEPPGLAR